MATFQLVSGENCKANTYQFLLYQALLPKRKQGGKRKRREEAEGGDGEDSGGFDANKYNALMEQYSSGNKGIHLFSCAMRHIDVLLSPIGALAMYLYIRFKMSKEFDSSFDFSRNKEWYNVKLYTDGTMQKMFKGISLKGYGTAMGQVAHALGVSSKHTTHLGCVLGPKVLKMQELSPEEIRVLGNWDPNVQESTYSTKLPMRVI
jgi:hypothetical protein